MHTTRKADTIRRTVLGAGLLTGLGVMAVGKSCTPEAPAASGRIAELQLEMQQANTDPVTYLTNTMQSHVLRKFVNINEAAEGNFVRLADAREDLAVLAKIFAGQPKEVQDEVLHNLQLISETAKGSLRYALEFQGYSHDYVDSILKMQSEGGEITVSATPVIIAVDDAINALHAAVSKSK